MTIPRDEAVKTLRKKPTPRQADSITAGALKLKFFERVHHVKIVQESIDKEFKEMQIELENAKALVNGTTA